MIFLDTNYLLRFLTRDIEEQFLKAKKVIIDKNSDKYISSVVLAETIYILENHYNLSKAEVINTLIDLLAVKHIKSANFLKIALEIYEIESISFYDAMIAAEAIESKYQLKTFDIKLRKVYEKYSL